MVILGPFEFHGGMDAWSEYLCMERMPDGSLELSSRSRELLGYGVDWRLGEVVWQESYNPDENEGCDLPLTVAGKAVWVRDGHGVVGRKLVPHTDEAVAVFRPSQCRDARAWLEEYGWSRAPNFETAMEMINAALSTARGAQQLR